MIEITLAGVEVWHVQGGSLVHDGYQAFDDGGWDARFSALLERNASRFSEGYTAGSHTENA